LKNIHDYIHEENPKAAKEFVKDLTEKLFSLAENGTTGHPRDWVSGGLRGFPYRERCFYFRIVEDRLVVVRILHGAQDVTTQDFPQS